MKTLTIAAPKGGSGKTTLALLLAVHAGTQGQRVALFDLNADQGNIAQWQASRGDLLGPTIIDVENITKDAKALAHSRRFDLLIVDTPPTVDDTAIVEAGVAIADLVLIPARPSILDIGTMPVAVEICSERRKRFVFVMCDCTTQWAALNDKAEAALWDMGPVLKARTTHRLAYVNAMTAGRVGSELDATCKSEAAAIWAEVTRALDVKKGR